MPKPSNATAFPRPDLATIAFEYSLTASKNGFIGHKVLPGFDTAVISAKYPEIPASVLLELPDTSRAPRAAYNRGDWEYVNKTFTCEENGWEEPVDDDEAEMYKTYFDAEEVATIRATNIIMRSAEKRVADKVFDKSTFETQAAAKGWVDYGNANPLADVNEGKKYFEGTTGLEANAIIFNGENFRHLGMIAAVIDRIKFTNPAVQKGEIPAALLAGYFGVDHVLVAGGAYNSAPKGKAAVAEKIWASDLAMLCRISSGGPDLREPSLGRTFVWNTGDAGSDGTPFVVEDYREEQSRSNIIRARQNTDERIQFAGAGYIIEGLSTPAA